MEIPEDTPTPLKFYFGLGLTYQEIVASLAYNHNIIISKRTLHRLLRKDGLYRRGHPSD